MLWLLRFAGGILGRVAYKFGIRSQVTLDNLRKAFPEMSEKSRRRIAARSYSNLGKVFFEFLILRFAGRRKIYDGLIISNLQDVEKAISESHGAILLSGHIANWEWLALGCSLRLDRNLCVIIKNQRSSIAERFLTKMRTRFGNRMMNAGDARAIYRALRQKQLLAILGDQTAGADDMRVPFFGREVPTFEGAARLALSTRAPIWFLQPYERTRKGYLCRFHEINFDDLAESNEDNVRTLTARHTAMLEKAIREKPEFWLWQHKRWKHAR
jgi:Kdo2-lipid IVA lauroyltransferase/acyltransferase